MGNRNFISFFVVLMAFAPSVRADDAVLQVRAVLHDPSQSGGGFFVGRVGETLVPLRLVEEGLTDPQTIPTQNGSLNLYSKAKVDKDNPMANLAATVKVPAGAGRAMVFILPSDKKAPPFSMVIVNDDAGSFPWGESKAVNLTPVDFAVEAGEHKILVPGGKIIAVPRVTKLDEYSRAQTNFYYKQEAVWVVAAERQMQFAKSLRRVFLIYKAPDAVGPDVRTIVDHSPPDLGGK